MTCAELWSILVQGLVAVGTLLLAVIAIWGDWIRHRLLGPNLTINLLDTEGTLNHITDGTPGRYYKLKVSNSRKWSPAINVRVILKNWAMHLTQPATTCCAKGKLCVFKRLSRSLNGYLATVGSVDPWNL